MKFLWTMVFVIIAHAIFLISKKITALKIPHFNSVHERMQFLLNKRGVFSFDELIRIIATYALLICGVGIEILFMMKLVPADLAATIEYALVVYAGMAIVVLCYVSYDYEKWIILPRFCRDSKKVKIKKIILYVAIALFSIVGGFYKYVLEQNAALWEFADGTYIMSIFAFERIVNALYDLKVKKQE